MIIITTCKIKKKQKLIIIIIIIKAYVIHYTNSKQYLLSNQNKGRKKIKIKKSGQEHGSGWCSVWVWFDSVAGDDGGWSRFGGSGVEE